MWNRKFTETLIQDENHLGSEKSEHKISSFDRTSRPEVKDYVFEPIRSKDADHYSEVKSKFGPLAATDAERSARTQKDSRFSINPLLRNSLSIEEEERRVIEARVQQIVTEIAEREKLAARSQGYQEGLKKGIEEAQKKIQIESADKIARFDQFLNEMENARTEIFRVNETIIMEMIFRISKLLLMKELTLDREYVLRLAKDLVSKVGVRENIIVRINPLDGEIIGLLKEGVEKTFGSITNFNVELSSKVKQSGCEIETEWNLINASIEAQLQEVYRALVPDGGGVGSPAAPKEQIS